MKILFGSDVSFRCRDGGITPENAAERVRSVKPVFDGADFRMVNLENVLYDSTAGEIIKSGPALRSSRHCVAFLKALGVDAVGLANNHFGDFGEAGMRSTWECLRENGIAWAGAGETLDDAYRALRFEKDGIRVAVIAACENEFGTATVTTPGSAGYAPLRLPRKRKQRNMWWCTSMAATRTIRSPRRKRMTGIACGPGWGRTRSLPCTPIALRDTRSMRASPLCTA